MLLELGIMILQVGIANNELTFCMIYKFDF